MGHDTDPRILPFRPRPRDLSPRAPAPTVKPGLPALRVDALEQFTCYSTEPEDDPGAQMRAGTFERTGAVPIRGSLPATLADLPPTPGVVLVDPRDGRVYGEAVSAPDLFCLAGYPEASHSPGDLVFTVGDRRAATAILRAAGIPWHGDHLYLAGDPDRGLRDVFLATLRHLAAYNLDALTRGAALLAWRDVFPSLRMAGPA